MAEKEEFEGQVAAVTGGAAGIGFAICKLLSQRGAQVCILDVDAAKAADSAEQLAQWGKAGRAYKADVTDEASMQAARDAILEDFGHIEILVNNAGIYPQGTIDSVAVEDWDKMFDVNAKGVFLTTRTFMRPMVEKKYGRIVTIVTIDAYNPKPTNVHYAASKAALLSLIRTFAAELAPHQVLCNGVSPGAVATERAKASDWLPKRLPLIPLGRAAEPEDMAEYVVFLASNRNRFMTGETVIASGGFMMI